jgi:soluble cytochrome b562
MKIKILLLGCVLGCSLPVCADETPLGRKMEAFDDSYKAFRKETDPAKGAAQAREAQELILKGIAELPALVAKMPDGEAKSKAVAEYRRMMGQLFVVLCEVEEAFLAGKIDEVAKLVDSLKEMKKTGHNRFMEDE